MIDKIKVEIAQHKKNFLREEYFVLKDITKTVAMPIVDIETLDETLDTTQITIYNRQQDPFMPFTKFIITLYEDGEGYRIYRYLDSDNVEQRTFGKNPIYCHKINLIEITKILEKEPVANLSFTNYLDSHIDNPVASWGLEVLRHKKFSYKYTIYLNEKRFQKFVNVGESIDLNVRMQTVYADTLGGTAKLEYLKTTIVPPNSEEIEQYGDSFIPDEEGQYKIYQYYYYGNINNPYDDKVIYIRVCWIFNVVEDKSAVKNIRYTLADVTNRLLRVGQTLLKGRTQKYILDSKIYDKLNAIESPELNFTNSTLFEALSEIGGIAHAIPRLIPQITLNDDNIEDYYSNWNIVTFDFLGGNDKFLNNKYSLNESQIASNNYAKGLVTEVQNGLMSIFNENSTITEPFSGGYLSLRTEKGNFEITKDNFCLKTLFPIGVVKKLTICYEGIAYDCTEYLVEKTVYETFKSYDSAAVIESKFGYLYYTRGECNVRGCDTQKEGSDFLSTLFNQYRNSLHYILKEKANVIDSEEVSGIDFSYNIEYIPYMNFLVKQRKSLINENIPEVYNFYNQTANVVDIEALGENVRGTLLKTGNVEYTETQYFHNYNEHPIIGQISFDNYYCFSVASEILVNSPIKITSSWSKDFNKLSDFIGYKKAIREYEVSERQSFERYVDYNEYLIISDKFDLADYYDDLTLAYKGSDEYTKNAIEKTFDQNLIGTMDFVSTAYNVWSRTSTKKQDPINSVIIQTYKSGKDTPIASFCLPVMSFIYGTSAVFLVKMSDNYSAATYTTKGAFNTSIGMLEDYIPYGDEHGRFDEMTVRFKQSPSINNTTKYSMSLYKSDDIDVSVTGRIIDFTSTSFIVDKDSRECISVMAQVSIVTDSKNVMIYKSVGSVIPYLETSDKIIYALFKAKPPINADNVSDYIISTLSMPYFNINYRIRTICTPSNVKITSDCVGVGLVNSDNKILVYKEGEVKTGENAPIFYFMFRDKT